MPLEVFNEYVLFSYYLSNYFLKKVWIFIEFFCIVFIDTL